MSFAVCSRSVREEGGDRGRSFLSVPLPSIPHACQHACVSWAHSEPRTGR